LLQGPRQARMESAAVVATASTSATIWSEIGEGIATAVEGVEVESKGTLTQASHATSAADIMVADNGVSPRKSRPRRRNLKLQREASTPQKPRRVRARSAYELFCAEDRPKVVDGIRSHSGETALNIGQLSIYMSERWSRLDATARACYHDLAMKERLALEATQKPKKPASSYLLFLQDPARRAQAEQDLKNEGKEATFVAMGAKLGQMWQVATPELKAELSAQQEKSMLEYKEKLERWQATVPSEPKCSLGKRKSGQASLEREADADTHDCTPATKRRNATNQARGVTPFHAASPSAPRKPRLVRQKSLTTLDLDAATLAEAQRLELEVPLLELANSPQLLEAGINGKTAAGGAEMLNELLKAKGMVDEAERLILLRVQQRSAKEAEACCSNQP